ncbi:Fc.00g063220.m01.CDS01 [Cosmosporella sp. VM-42]
MATQVLIAHTGQRLEVDTAQFNTLDDLKNWVSRNSSIPVPHVIALTPQGRMVKTASLHSEKEIFIYDLRISQPEASDSSSTLISKVPVPKKYSVPNAPNSIEDVQAISSWQNLYKDRRNWAVRLVEDSSRMSATIQARYGEIDVISKCLDAAMTNLEISIKGIEPKYTELKKWVMPTLENHDHLVTQWERSLDLAKKAPISSAMAEFMTGQVSKPSPTLYDLIELDTMKKAAKLAPTAHRRFKDNAAELDKVATQMYEGLEGLIGDFDKLMNRSVFGHGADAAQLLEDIEAVAKQIDSDYRTALGYSGSQRDITLASKTASNHTERLVPTLKKRVKEMDEILHYVTESRNSIASESAGFMRLITDVTFLHKSVKNQINVINQSEVDMTTFDYLRLIEQLPYMYTSFVVEAIRRREWVDKVKTDSSTLANEMALFQDEESKRRRKWQKSVGNTYGPELNTNVVGLEVNLLGEEKSWPAITKDELEDFIQVIQHQEVDQGVLEDIVKLVQELNNPTRQQTKRLKAFKNGSVHEAALGRSGLMIRGDDDLLRSLRDDKSKLENRLKTAESRVRRLEDLLHRQSQASRPGNLFQPQSPQPRDRHDSGSSIRSNRADDRRLSSDGIDPLLRRITQLENELREEKHRSTQLQQDLTTQTTQHDSMKGQIEEVKSTKNDLLGNMDALQREFIEERKSLEETIKALKARLEDTEDEIDHFDQSRQHEKAGYVGKVVDLEAQIERMAKDRQEETFKAQEHLKTLEAQIEQLTADRQDDTLRAEIEKLTRERQDDILKAQGQVEFLRKETRIQREQQETMERQLQTAHDESRNVSKKLKTVEETSERQLETLEKLHVQLAPDDPVPNDILSLADSVLSRASDLLTELQNVERDRNLLKSDLEQAASSAKELRAQITETTAKLSEEEARAMQLRENLSEEKAKVAALESELTEAQGELSGLRAKLSDGQTGSENLQKRLEEEEKKVTTLTEEVASRQSQVGSLEEELRLFQEKIVNLQGKLVSFTSRSESRDEKTKDLTQRLYSHNDRLTRLLERVGFAITRKDGLMAINKIPRSERTPQNPNDSSDPGSSIRRSGTLNRALADSTELQLLYWLDNTDEKAEAEKYEAFMNTLGNFDLDLFSDTVYRRIKEVEHLARKWQREARAYREKAHVMQKDSHDKIAFKHFKEGDLALFLPTRNQQAGAWAAFNVGFPHYFLREQDAHRLGHREWLVARISRIQERVVDLSKSLQPSETDSLNDDENDNPFQLSDGLRWYLIDAHEDKPGAPSTPGMGKSTVAANTVEATANIHAHGGKGKSRDSVNSIEGIGKTLSKSLESRRSSSGSKKGTLPFNIGGGTGLLKNSALASETNSLRAAPTDTPTAASPTQGSILTAANASLAQKAQAATQREGKEAQKHPEDGNRSNSHPGESSEAAKPDEPRITVQREESESKNSVVWDSLWSVDYNYESGGKK